MKHFILGVFFILGLITASFAEQPLKDYCSLTYVKEGVCPAKVCELKCLSAERSMTVDECNAAGNKLFYCVAKSCDQFSIKDCPKESCELVTTCSKEQVCGPKVPAEQIPSCGGLAYNGQAVGCCSGLIKRCGFDYLDGTCNMEGKNTPYQFAICIPCGDGVCGNFENHCNCPEDCKKILIPLKK